ncbi:MAG: M48 family metalloprotease [Saccharospirillaceae bacterium]|nr:M48 family metalloprotease [Pseudomonadales bacterium]NRB80746.1 M48 family metalloprotease [Saccharospirillaceae bacterium]
MCLPNFFKRLISVFVVMIVIVANASALTSQQRQQVGEIWTRNFYQQADTFYDPIVANYSLQLLNDLSPNAKLFSRDIHVILVDDTGLNAFSVIGNVIGINKGLFYDLTHADQLYGILAHELAHVGQNHLIRSVEENKHKSTLMLASILAAILISPESSELSTALLVTSQGFLQSSALSFSREMETEADRIGIDILKKSNINPVGMYEVFLKLQTGSLGFNMPGEYLLTHPLTINRLSDMRPRTISSTPITTHKYKDLEFQWIKARFGQATTISTLDECLKLNHLNPTQCWKAQYDEYSDNILLSTIYAESMVKKKDKQGIELLNLLLKINPNNNMIMNQLFLAYVDFGQYQNAVKLLQKLPDQQNPRFHQIALGVANQTNHNFLKAKHQFLQLWHSAHEQEAVAYVDRVLILNEFDLPTKNRLRSFYQQYVNIN